MAGSDEFKKDLAQASDKRARAELASDPARLGPLAAAAREKYGLEGFSDKEIAMATKGTNFGDKDYLRLNSNKRMRSEIGSDPERLAKRLEAVDRNAFDFDGYTDKEINMAFRGGNFGEKDYARLTGKSVGSDKPITAPTPAPTPTPEPVQEDPTNDIGNGPGMDRPIVAPEIPIVIERPVVEAPVTAFGLDTGSGSYNVGRIDANIGKRGDMTTSIGDGNTFGAGASIGNDMSTTIGSQMFGNSLSLPRRSRAEQGAFAGLVFN